MRGKQSRQMRTLFWMFVRWITAIVLAFSSAVFSPVITAITTRTSFGLLRLFTDATVKDSTIAIGATTVNIIPACAAVSAYLLLALLILLTNGISLRKGILLFCYGSLLIFIANIFRIELLIYILHNYGTNYFETVHLFIWKIVASIYVAFVWVFLTWRFQITAMPIVSDMQHVIGLAKKKPQECFVSFCDRTKSREPIKLLMQ